MGVTFPPTVDRMSGVPGVTRATGLISGLIRQMTMDAIHDGMPRSPRPRILEKPDPMQQWGRARFIGCHVDDYLRHGNAVSLVTARDADGVPQSAMWLPAMHVQVADLRPYGGELTYWYLGQKLTLGDVVHVARGADPWNPARGVGVIEQHLTAWGLWQKQARYESDAYDQSGVPSVAVTTPNQDLSQAEADAAKSSWMEKFARREPVILPQGTTVVPLAWSPSDSQMVEAHQMTLQDISNAFGMDGYWLGAPVKGMTYKSPGLLYLALVRETIEPISDDFEQVWGPAWFPWGGDELRFRKQDILTDDMASEAEWLVKALGAKIVDLDEARDRLGYAPRDTVTGSTDGGAVSAREAAEVSQKVYLAVVNDVLSRPEARALIRRAGAELEEETDDRSDRAGGAADRARGSRVRGAGVPRRRRGRSTLSRGARRAVRGVAGRRLVHGDVQEGRVLEVDPGSG